MMTNAQKKTWRFQMSELFIELVRLSLRVNQATDFAVSWRHSGIFDECSMKIWRDKTGLRSELVYEDAFSTSPWENSEEEAFVESDFEMHMARMKSAREKLLLILEGKELVRPEVATA